MATTLRRTRGTDKQENLITALRAERVYDHAVADSKRTASALIKYLFTCSKAANAPLRPLSVSQVEMIRRVATELGRDDDAELARFHAFTDYAARSAAITALVDEAKAQREANQLMRVAAQQLPVNHGYVLPDGRYARSYRSETHKVWAKVLTDNDSWERIDPSALVAPGVRPITLADAEIIAQRTRTCGHCGRAIETDESVARGVGPICASKF